MYWPFKTSTHSQSEIFSLKAVIVACSLCSYTVAFQDQHTLPKRNILSHSCYCGLLSLLVYSGLSGPAHPPKEKYSLKAVIVACSVYLRFRTSTPCQREIFSQSCYCGLLVWSFLSGPAHPPKYTRAERTSCNNRKYFTLGGGAGLERPIHMSRENKLQ